MIYDFDLLMDTCWVVGCNNLITLRELNTSTFCKHHEANLLADMFGLPDESVTISSR